MNLTRIDTVSYSAAHIVDFRVREEGANPSVPPLSMGTKPANATVRFDGWEGTGSRTNHEPEDLPGELILFPRGLGSR